MNTQCVTASGGSPDQPYSLGGGSVLLWITVRLLFTLHVCIWVIQVIIDLVILKIIDPRYYMRELYCNGSRGASGIEPYRSVR